VREVDVQGVQSHLSVELAESTEQAVGASLRGGQSRLQDLEEDTIQSFSIPVSFLY
jgi:hypothetical protein